MSTRIQGRVEPADAVGGDDSAAAPAPDANAVGVKCSAAPRRPGPWRRIHFFVKELEPWGVLLGAVALCIAVVSFWTDYSDLVEQRTVRAWQLLTTRASGNSGKIAALEYLNRQGARLVGIDLSSSSREGGSVFLERVQLVRANLNQADLRKAHLWGANLSQATLFRANLTQANLTRADLPYADLTAAKLKGVILNYADLSGAVIIDANLTGATAEKCQPQPRILEPFRSERRMAHRGKLERCSSGQRRPDV